MQRLKLYAQRSPDGEVRATWLLHDGETLAVWEESGLEEEVALPLPASALERVFARYGKPLDAASLPAAFGEPPDDDARPLVCGAGTRVTEVIRRFRFMPYGWVHPADYLLLERGDAEPLAAPAPLVASALAALARAAAAA